MVIYCMTVVPGDSEMHGAMSFRRINKSLDILQ